MVKMRKILIVDDDRNFCRCLEKLINWAELGCYEPVVAYNGVLGWEQIEKQLFDLVICDLNMPIMGGAELCSKIKAKYPDIAIVFVSAYANFEVARKAMQFGVKDYILKPINSECLESLKRIVQTITSESVI